MELGLGESICLVAGSTRGLGKAIASRLLEEGSRVVITGRDKKTLQKTLREFQDKFGAESVASFVGDLSHDRDINGALGLTRKRFGPVNGLVANIGSGKAERGWDLSAQEWSRVFEKNLWASVRLIQKVLPGMIKNKGGSIVSIASIVGLESLNAPLSYSAAKAALIHYNKNLSRLAAPDNIRVNVVAPGNILFKGGSWDKKLKRNPRAVKNYIEREVPLKRFGTVEEIADLTVYLLSGRASFITGSCFVADGGQLRSV